MSWWEIFWPFIGKIIQLTKKTFALSKLWYSPYTGSVYKLNVLTSLLLSGIKKQIEITSRMRTHKLQQLFYMDKNPPPPSPTDTCTHLERQGYHLSEAVISWCTAPAAAPHSQPDLWGNYGKNVCLSIPGVERTDRDIKQITLYTKWNVMAADQERSLCVVIWSSLIDGSFPVEVF